MKLNNNIFNRRLKALLSASGGETSCIDSTCLDLRGNNYAADQH